MPGAREKCAAGRFPLVARSCESVAGARDDETFENVVTLVETYFREGGLHLQLNRVSREELLDAKAHPEDHASLRVRVSGFSAYFTTLAPAIQDDVLARTVH